MPAIETVAMPKVAGKARSYIPACTARQTKDFHIKTTWPEKCAERCSFSTPLRGALFSTPLRGTLFSTPLRGIRSRNEIEKMDLLLRNGS